MTFIPRKEEPFMNKRWEYSSVLSPNINGFVFMKETSGYNYLRGRWILLEIDRFFQENDVHEPIITRGLIEQWRKTRINDSPSTIYSKYSIISQLARYMSRQGQDCFMPRLPRASSSQCNFTPYIFTHEQIERILRRRKQRAMKTVEGFDKVYHQMQQQTILGSRSHSTLDNYIRRIALVCLEFNRLPEDISEEEINAYLVV
jgi:integrase